MPEPPEDEPTASAPANGPAGAVDPPEPADDAEERGRLAAVLAARRDTDRKSVV